MRSWILSAFLLLICAGSLLASDDRPIVVFRVDDCQSSWASFFSELGGQSALQYGMEKAIPITWGAPVSLLGKSGYLTVQQLQAYLEAAGGEIASHSVKHAAMSNDAEYENELVSSSNQLKALFPNYFKGGFIQPGTWQDHANFDSWPKLQNDIGIVLRNTFNWSQSYIYSAKKIGGVPYPHGMKPDYSLDFSSYDQPDETKVLAKLEDIAATHGLIYVIYGHGVQRSNDTTSNIRADVLRAVIDELVWLRDSGKIRLMGAADAFSQQFSADINHLPNAGFERELALWNKYDGAAVSSIGHNGSTAALDLSSSAGSHPAIGLSTSLPPGEYELEWYQRCESSDHSTPIVVSINQSAPGIQCPSALLFDGSYADASRGVWERKSLHFITIDGFPQTNLTLMATSGSHYLVDDMSLKLVSLPPQPPTNAVAIPCLRSCVVQWLSPTNSNVKSVSVRVADGRCPINVWDGRPFAQVSAVPGTTQSVNGELDWSSYKNGAFFSIFAIDNDNLMSAPCFNYSQGPINTIAKLRMSIGTEEVTVEDIVVTAVFGDSFYVESCDRSCAIRVYKAGNDLAVGTKVKITGTAAKSSDGECYIIPIDAIPTASGDIKPVYMNLRDLGGVDVLYDGPAQRWPFVHPIVQPGVTGGRGPNNVGMLVRVVATVTVAGNPCIISQGDDAQASVVFGPTESLPTNGTTIMVTGISSRYIDQTTGKAMRQIKATSWAPLTQSNTGPYR